MPASSKSVALPPNAKEATVPSNAKPMERILGGISLKTLEGFSRRMATGTRSGVDLLRLLDMETRVGNARHRNVAAHMIELVRSGHGLADAMKEQGDYFPVLFMKMIDASEHAGSIERGFREMADYYHELKQTKSAFLSQITLPVIQLIVAIGICCILILVNGFFGSGSSQDAPFDLTGIGLRGGTGVVLFLMVIGIVFGCIGVVAFAIWKNWFGCHKTLVPLVRNVPVIGTVLTTTAMSRLSMTLSMMLGAGVDAKRSVRDAILSTGNHYYISGLQQTLGEIGKGASFAEALEAPKLLPDEFIQAVAVGEMSGSDSESLERMAITYRERAQLALKQLAIAAGFAVWMMIAVLIIIVIFTVFRQILQVYSNALNMK
jgi:type IV pilus assembly protein PilC